PRPLLRGVDPRQPLREVPRHRHLTRRRQLQLGLPDRRRQPRAAGPPRPHRDERAAAGGVAEVEKERAMTPALNTLFRGAAAAMLLLAAAWAPARASKLDVEVWTDRGEDAVYQEGDNIGIKVRSNGDAYLLVYELDTDGRVNLLYPLKRGPNRIENHETLNLPDPQSHYQLVIEPNPTTGQAVIVAGAPDSQS